MGSTCSRADTSAVHQEPLPAASVPTLRYASARATGLQESDTTHTAASLTKDSPRRDCLEPAAPRRSRSGSTSSRRTRRRLFVVTALPMPPNPPPSSTPPTDVRVRGSTLKSSSGDGSGTQGATCTTPTSRSGLSSRRFTFGLSPLHARSRSPLSPRSPWSGGSASSRGCARTPPGTRWSPHDRYTGYKRHHSSPAAGDRERRGKALSTTLVVDTSAPSSVAGSAVANSYVSGADSVAASLSVAQSRSRSRSRSSPGPGPGPVPVPGSSSLLRPTPGPSSSVLTVGPPASAPLLSHSDRVALSLLHQSSKTMAALSPQVASNAAAALAASSAAAAPTHCHVAPSNSSSVRAAAASAPATATMTCMLVNATPTRPPASPHRLPPIRATPPPPAATAATAGAAASRRKRWISTSRWRVDERRNVLEFTPSGSPADFEAAGSPGRVRSASFPSADTSRSSAPLARGGGLAPARPGAQCNSATSAGTHLTESPMNNDYYGPISGIGPQTPTGQEAALERSAQLDGFFSPVLAVLQSDIAPRESMEMDSDDESLPRHPSMLLRSHLSM